MISVERRKSHEEKSANDVQPGRPAQKQPAHFFIPGAVLSSLPVVYPRIPAVEKYRQYISSSPRKKS